MEAHRTEPAQPTTPRVDWEAFYRNFRKPGYIAGFEIVNKLGGGMFGLVFKARKESIGKDYAIKFLKVDDESVRDAVGRELETVQFFAQIDHPNLVSIEDKGAVDGIPYLIMSYAGQETLQKRLEQGRMPREDALRIFAQAARGVQALHDHSLVHFDLKPANVFLKGDVARVGDYGLSKLVSASRNSLSFGRGTPYYMAPEMLQRRGDARSDIYSLGVMLYECLYGDVPFRGDSEWEVLRKHEVAEPVFPADALPGDRAIIQRCLAKRPEDRFASAGDLLRALQAPVALGDSLVFTAAPAPGPGAAVTATTAARVTGVPATGARATGAAAMAEPPPLPVVPPARDPARSPHGLPWQPEDRRRHLFGAVGRMLGTATWLAVYVTVALLRGLSIATGRTVAWLVRLPFRILGVLFRLLGLVAVAGVVLLVVVAMLKVVAAF